MRPIFKTNICWCLVMESLTAGLVMESQIQAKSKSKANLDEKVLFRKSLTIETRKFGKRVTSMFGNEDSIFHSGL